MKKQNTHSVIHTHMLLTNKCKVKYKKIDVNDSTESPWGTEKDV